MVVQFRYDWVNPVRGVANDTKQVRSEDKFFKVLEVGRGRPGCQASAVVKLFALHNSINYFMLQIRPKNEYFFMLLLGTFQPLCTLAILLYTPINGSKK